LISDFGLLIEIQSWRVLPVHVSRLTFHDKSSPMLKKLIICCCCIGCFAFLQAQKKNAPVPIIFDSDMGPDYDDVGAITILHAYADSGKAKILATVASTKYPGVAGVLNAFNTYFNRPGIPVGVPKGKALELRDFQHWTDTVLARYPHAIKSNDDAPDAVEVYRKTLAAQPDNSVTIVTVGFLTNLSNLLQSGPDSYSKLDGKTLVKQKVKQLVCMGGKFPEGYEFNVQEDAGASQYVYTQWETPIIFSGFEIGEKIKAGILLIHNNAIHNSPVKDVFRISIPMAKEDSVGRMSWDETAVLTAINGYSPYYTLHYGHIEVAGDGKDKWLNDGTKQAYLVEAVPPAVVQALINKLIMHQPGKSH
jgi:inosine-uridine nucleoside N-ribohydrolase